MSRSTYLANRLREVFIDGRWIANTNYKEQIQAISWQQATHEIAGLNSIAALTYHINYYLEGLLYAFEKGALTISDKYSFDMPPITQEAEWQSLVADFLRNAEAFANRVSTGDDKQLDEIFIDERYGSYLRNIEAVIEHSYYHLGQITLLKKLQIAYH